MGFCTMDQLSRVEWLHALLPAIDGTFRAPRNGWVVVSSRGQRSDASRPTLHYIRGYRRECRIVTFAGADTNDLFQRLDENFPVADFARARRRQNRLDRRF